MNYRAADSADWQSRLGADAWMPFVSVEAKKIECGVQLHGESGLIGVPLDFRFVHAITGETIMPREVFREAWERMQPPPRLARYEATGDLSEHALLRSDAGVLTRIERLRITFEASASAYYFNVRFHSGEVLESTQEGRGRVDHLSSHGMDWQALMKQQDSRELSEDEYEKLLEAGRKGRALVLEPSKLKRFIRLRVERTRPDDECSTDGPSA